MRPLFPCLHSYNSQSSLGQTDWQLNHFENCSSGGGGNRGLLRTLSTLNEWQLPELFGCLKSYHTASVFHNSLIKRPCDCVSFGGWVDFGRMNHLYSVLIGLCVIKTWLFPFELIIFHNADIQPKKYIIRDLLITFSPPAPHTLLILLLPHFIQQHCKSVFAKKRLLYLTKLCRVQNISGRERIGLNGEDNISP